jgi:hypothetical protein
MVETSKNLFLSYRRALCIDLAGRVHDNLVSRGYDVFFDVSSISSGQFGETIFHQIEARPLFVPILVPGCLERAVDAKDWFRREVEHALAKKRHIVPVAAKGFSFDDERKRLGDRKKPLPGRLEDLGPYHFIVFHDEYFKEGLEKLIRGLDDVPKGIDVRPTSAAEQATVKTLAEYARVAKPNAAGTGWIFKGIGPTFSMPLLAPKLEQGITLVGCKLKWSSVIGAAGYILERSVLLSFRDATQIHDGDQTEYVDRGLTANALISTILAGTSHYYRVKAKGGALFDDSPWSNVVRVETERLTWPAISPDNPLPAPTKTKKASIPLLVDVGETFKFSGIASNRFLNRPPPPKLSSRTVKGPDFASSDRQFTWTPVEKAAGYVLEKDTDRMFPSPTELYRGEKTAFTEALVLAWNTAYYRVKATSLIDILDSDWSEIVEVGPRKLR